MDTNIAPIIKNKVSDVSDSNNYIPFVLSIIAGKIVKSFKLPWVTIKATQKSWFWGYAP